MQISYSCLRRSIVGILGISTMIAVGLLTGCGSSTPAAPAAVLTITKTHTGSFSQGQSGATYTVTVANTGNAPTTGTVTVTETAPTGLTLISMAGTGWTCTAGGTTCTRSDALATGASYPTIGVTVNVALTATSPLVNQVSVSGGGAAANASASDSTTILVPALGITKTHTGSFAQGQQGATYTATVKNNGTGATNGTTVTVTETVPSGLTLVSMSGTGWTCSGTTCTRTDALAAGSSYPAITVAVNVGASAASPLVNSISVSGGGSVNASTTDSTTIITSSLSITKTHSGNFSQGQLAATYAVTVSNAALAAPTNGTAVTVTDTVPAGLTLVSMVGTGWTCLTNACTRSDVLAAGSSYPLITVTVNVGLNASSPQVNSVSVSGGGSATANTTDSTIILAPVLSITKAHSGAFTQGQVNATYTVTVSNSNAANTGSTNGTPVTVTDTLPSGLTLVSMAGTGWTCPANSCTRTDVLAPGASYPAITVTVNVAANASTPQVNQVSVSGGGSATANTSDSTTITEPVLSITKTHTGNFTQGQSNATYTVTVSNSGTLPTSGTVTVTETVPSGLTLVSMAGTGWTCPGTAGANTCDRSDVLANGSGYPAITVTVNVGASASSPQVNQVSASGGGSATANASDSTNIGTNCPTGGNLGVLTGQYAFTLSGFDAGGPVALGGSFDATGDGHIASTVGVEDVNRSAGVQNLNINTASSSYTVGTDNRGCLTINTTAGTSVFRFSLGTFISGVATNGRLIEFDSTGTTGSGVIRKQDATAFLTSQINGNYAFGVSSPFAGTANKRFAGAGVGTFSAGSISAGAIDVNDGGTIDNNGSTYPATPVSFTGLYNIGANGRGTTSFTIGAGSVNSVVYVVSSSELLIMNVDAQPSGAPFTGSALKQSGAFTSASLNATFVLNISSSFGSGADVLLGLGTPNGSGTFNFSGDESNAGVLASQTFTGGTYTVASNGRTTITGTGSHNPVFYLVSANKGFVLGTDNSVSSGAIEPQTGGPFTNASVSGAFSFGSLPPVEAPVSDEVGVATFNGLTTVSGTSDSTTGSTLNSGQPFSETYSFTPNGRGTLVSGNSIFYLISPTKLLIMSTTDPNPSIEAGQQ